MNQSVQDPLVGTLFDNRYLINHLVARGGMGNIYQAHDTKRGHIVAVKLLRSEYCSDRVMVQRFLREANVVRSLKHDNICQLYDMGQTATGEHYFTMEFLEGHALDQILEQQKVLSADVAVNYIIQVARGLSDAHAHGIVHRDLKPGNIFIMQTPNAPDFVKVLDFGVAKTPESAINTWDPKLTNAGSTVGTPFYMSPEQIRGTSDVDGRSDIYSLGVILWECIFGAPPFLGNSLVEVFDLALKKPIPKLTARYKKHITYVRLYKVLKKALEKEPRNRYQSMDEFIHVLKKCVPQVKSMLPVAGTLQSESGRGQIPGDESRVQQIFHTLLHKPAYLAAAIGGVCAIILAIIFAVVLPGSDSAFSRNYINYKFYSDSPCTIEINGKKVTESPSNKNLVTLKKSAKIKFIPKESKDKSDTVTFELDENTTDVTGFAVNVSSKETDSPKLIVNSDPPGARVYIDKQVSGARTPCDLELPSNKQVRVTIDKSGYLTEEILVDHQNADVHIDAKLSRRND